MKKHNFQDFQIKKILHHLDWKILKQTPSTECSSLKSTLRYQDIFRFSFRLSWENIVIYLNAKLFNLVSRFQWHLNHIYTLWIVRHLSLRHCIAHAQFDGSRMLFMLLRFKYRHIHSAQTKSFNIPNQITHQIYYVNIVYMQKSKSLSSHSQSGAPI